MIFKIESGEVVINGRKVLKTLFYAYLTAKIYKAMTKPKEVYYIVLDDEPKQVKKVQRTSKKKQKVESN